MQLILSRLWPDLKRINLLQSARFSHLSSRQMTYGGWSQGSLARSGTGCGGPAHGTGLADG